MSERVTPMPDDREAMERAWKRFNGLTHPDVSALVEHPHSMKRAFGFGFEAAKAERDEALRECEQEREVSDAYEKERDWLEDRLRAAEAERDEAIEERDMQSKFREDALEAVTQLEAEVERLREALRACQGEAGAIATGQPSEEHIIEYQQMAHNIFNKARAALSPREDA